MRFSHILFPTDFSEDSLLVGKQVEWLAERFGSEVTIMNVFEIPAAWYGGPEAGLINVECFKSLSDAAQQRLNEFNINVPATRVHRVLAQGEAAYHITHWADEHDVDLIMMGTRGQGSLRRMLLGSVTAKVMHDSRCPVWTDSFVHKQTSAKAPKVNTIICALETTNEAVPLLRYTADLAKEFNARVCLVNSVPASESRPLRYLEFDLHKYLVESVRSEIADLQKEAQTDFPVYISSEPISHAITHVAKQQDADLIVIGRGKAQDAFGVLRTHAYQIIRDSPCPVLSYSMDQQARTSSSYSAEHLAQSEADAPLPTGSRLP